MMSTLRKAGLSFAVVAVMVIASLTVLGAAPTMGANDLFGIEVIIHVGE